MLLGTKPNKTAASIEITPMLDMVFLLLIFFLVATTFHQEEREMQIALPIATAAQPISSMLREIIINVSAEGEIIVSGDTLEVAELEELIVSAVESNPEQKVTVRGDRSTTYANIVRVLDVCKHNGIQEPYLDTVLDVGVQP